MHILDTFFIITCLASQRCAVIRGYKKLCLDSVSR